MVFLGFLKLGLLYVGFLLQQHSASGQTCTLTADDFARGAALDISSDMPSDGSDPISQAHEIGGGNFQGDMVLTPEQWEVMAENKPPTGRNNKILIKHWPRKNGIVNVPYIMSVCDYTDNEKARLARAIKEYEDKTCIRLVPRTNETDYINIIKDDGCYSSVGKTGGAQDLSLVTGCLYDVGTPIHEFMHAIGYKHEQSRPDRDDYVTIHISNVESGQEHNFNKCVYCDTQNSPYDFESVMHYGAKDFSTNGQDTITANNGESFGQRVGFSTLDVAGINKFYCDGECVGACATCCDTLEVSGLSSNTWLEGSYTKQSGVQMGRNYYKMEDCVNAGSGPEDCYLYWTGFSWIFNYNLGEESGYLLDYGCRYVMGNKCPSVCGSVWGAGEISAGVKVECAVDTSHCNNTVQDSDESGVDCGGVSCESCGNSTDGNWGNWSPWSKCKAKCPKTSGLTFRSRKCDNPAPADGGAVCPGKMKEEKSCTIKITDCLGSCKEKCPKKKCSSCKTLKSKCKKEKKVKKQCPVTCGQCKNSGGSSGGSGGTKPNKKCKDKAGSKKCKKDKKKCKKDKKVQKNCQKTCKKCKK